MTYQQHILEALEMICCQWDTSSDIDLAYLIDDQAHLLSGGDFSESIEECFQ
ncbi:MAG: hypothetical protein HON68_07520 [Gammaproteobacteria bacterium]|jgi:hypothetical protein|nr:hypothetical protein [Gammaproteobacteria bacterium]MBT5467931.1 hypothetical protein [Candidatus Neomarinimicrobiota bacterium]MBT3717307.1 hypothetical protein [Gammaproteobacteria bacterium]MBT3844828.1 hypothetical protein [Gammaproteobacteria bacterium]MBT3894054.1 hypothetical protein [Gammaproteobacteria bacterium]